MADCNPRTYRYISDPFGFIPPAPPLKATGFSFRITSNESSEPLRGNLSFLYSTHNKVPFNSILRKKSVLIADNLRVGNNQLAIFPAELENVTERGRIFFAYQYKASKNPNSTKDSESFTFETLIQYKEPNRISDDLRI